MQFFTHATPEIAVLEITASTATNVHTVTTLFLSASTDQAIFLLVFPLYKLAHWDVIWWLIYKL